MKRFAAVIMVFILTFSFSMSVNAGDGHYNGTVNGKSFSMTYSCSKWTATCYISCPTAQNVEAIVFVLYKTSTGDYTDSISAYNEPGTVATAIWNAGTGRTITGSIVSGYVNNIQAYGTTVGP